MARAHLKNKKQRHAAPVKPHGGAAPVNKMSGEKIDIAWCDPGMTEGWFAWSIANAWGELTQMGAQGMIHRTSGAVLNKNRNKLVELFLEGGSDWLFMVDSDMILDDSHILKLWVTAKQHDVEMVGGLAFIWSAGREPIPNFFIEKDDEIVQVKNHIPEQPFPAVATGLATALVHRDVFLAMTPPRLETFRWFDDIPLDKYPEQDVAGEDVQFFVRAGELGFRLLIDPNARTGHIKDFPVGYPDWYKVWKQGIRLGEVDAPDYVPVVGPQQESRSDNKDFTG